MGSEEKTCFANKERRRRRLIKSNPMHWLIESCWNHIFFVFSLSSSAAFLSDLTSFPLRRGCRWTSRVFLSTCHKYRHSMMRKLRDIGKHHRETEKQKLSARPFHTRHAPHPSPEWPKKKNTAQYPKQTWSKREQQAGMSWKWRSETAPSTTAFVYWWCGGVVARYQTNERADENQKKKKTKSKIIMQHTILSDYIIFEFTSRHLCVLVVVFGVHATHTWVRDSATRASYCSYCYTLPLCHWCCAAPDAISLG